MALLFNKLLLRKFVKVPVRYRNGPDHWATLRKKKTAKDKALKHFDEFYETVYGDSWLEIRTALLEPKTKYLAVVNNYSDTERIRSDLELHGAVHLKAFYDVRKEYKRDQLKSKNSVDAIQSQNINNRMDTIISNAQLSEVQSVYPIDYPQSLDTLRSEKEEEEEEEENESIKKDNPLQPVELKSIDENLNEIDIDTSRIIDTNVSLSTVYEFVPATKIKGMEDWVLESDHYRFYNQGADFRANISKESVLSFPSHLHVYTYDANDDSRFPAVKKGSTDVLDYYLFDGGSILPVLALDLQPGDAVLDMCAAPGGKTLTILQTLLPSIVVANDISRSRTLRIHNLKEQYLSNINEAENMLYITQKDARIIEDKDAYNKILVDVPCTTDRHVLHTDENNMFKSSRVKERIKLPELQSEILANALRLVAVGGTVVYSTCTLSPIQNDGVVQAALKKSWVESNSIMVVKDMSEVLSPLEDLYEFANIGLKYGHIAVPTKNNNWGPMYFCKIERVR